MMKAEAEMARLHRRCTNQRRELRKLNRYIVQQGKWLENANMRATYAQKRLSEVYGRGFRAWLRKAWRRKAWIWFRNRIVWRIGCFIRGNRRHWDQRMWYAKGKREGEQVARTELWAQFGIKK